MNLISFSELRTLFHFRIKEPYSIFGQTNLRNIEPYFIFGLMNPIPFSDQRTFGLLHQMFGQTNLISFSDKWTFRYRKFACSDKRTFGTTNPISFSDKRTFGLTSCNQAFNRMQSITNLVKIWSVPLHVPVYPGLPYVLPPPLLFF